MPSPLPTGRQYQVRLIHNFDIRAGEYFVMAGITTSETMNGEQPKDDNLGCRVDEIKAELDKLLAECDKQREASVLLRCRVMDQYDELKKQINDGR